MSASIDSARPPRSGEELPADVLGPWLREALGRKGDLVVEQFPSGWSNLTYLLRLGDLELVLRRPPFGNREATAHDMLREHRVLAALSRVWPLAPAPLASCEDPDVLGAPFYVMERRRGVILRRKLPGGVDLTPVLSERLSERFADHLADLHSIDWRGIGLGDLGRPDGYVERQVKGWARRYEKAQTDSWPELDRVVAWLHEERPGESGAALVHNDFKYDNLVLDPRDLTRVVAVLDWEMATVGDPLLDLGTSLAYWVESLDDERWQAVAFGPTNRAGTLGRRALAERWSRRTGIGLDHLVFAYAFGLFKLAVIAQQIYWRWANGHTTDERFAGLNRMVGLIGELAAAAVDRDRV